MDQAIELRIILESPTTGVDFGLQKGKGSDYQTVQIQRSAGSNLLFEFPVTAKLDEGSGPVFTGPFAQGSPQDRFVYLDIGTYAGQKDSAFGRRLKIPLKISAELVEAILPKGGTC